MIQSLSLSDLAVIGAVCVLFWFIHSKISTSNLNARWNTLPGPPPSSFKAGNLGELFGPKGMKYHEEYIGRYGSAFRVHGLFGEKQLFVSDPQAISTMLAEVDTFPTPNGLRSLNHLIFGRLSVFATRGQQHRKLRKMLNPVFTKQHIKGLTSGFQSVAHKLVKAMEREMKSKSAPSQDRKASVELDVFQYVSCTALDLIGLGSLGYDFKTLEGVDDPYVRAAKNLLPAISEIAFITPILHILLQMGPRFFRRLVVLLIPMGSVQRFRKVVDVMDSTAWSIFKSKKAKEEERLLKQASDKSLGDDAEGVDIISLTLRQNVKNPKLTDEEIVGQIGTLVFAGFETSSGAIVRTLQQLSEKPEMQRRLREEVVEALNANNNVDLDFDTLDALPYLDAVCSETLRLFPPVPWMSRTASVDTALSLLKPIKSSDKSTDIHSIPVPKGTTIYISVSGVHRNPEIWGADSNEYRPERWLDSLPPTVAAAKIPSLWSSVLSFSAGPRGCVGFRFGVLEMKIVLSTLIRSFEFKPADKEVEWLLSLTESPHITKEGVLVPSLPFIVSKVEESEA